MEMEERGTWREKNHEMVILEKIFDINSDFESEHFLLI